MVRTNIGLNSAMRTLTSAKSVAVILCFCVIFMGVIGGMVIRPAEASDEESKRGEYGIKAAFLYNVLQFIEWPDDKNISAGSTINICILGDDPFDDTIDFFQQETIGNRKLVIKRLRIQKHIRDCQVLFISSSEKGNIEHILTTVKGLNVLTVGDTEGFSQRGVLMNFYLEKNRVRFEINLNSLRLSGLRISSKVLQLARIIKG